MNIGMLAASHTHPTRNEPTQAIQTTRDEGQAASARGYSLADVQRMVDVLKPQWKEQGVREWKQARWWRRFIP